MSARVLVIEDNPANLELMAYLLKAFKYTVLTAENGEDGVAAAERETPDLVICDVHLPRMDGYGVVQKLKHDERTRRIPLIAVTALAMVGDRDKLLAAGFDGYIAKPITPETFVKEIESHLGANKRSQTTDTRADPPMHSTAHPDRRGLVLIVDDSPVNRELIRHTLEPFGYETRLANSVAEGLERLKESPPPDLILSDLHMPNQDGFAFIKAAKADPALKAVPFVFISSSVWGDKDRNTALALGATRFILRPIEPQALLQEINAVLDAPGVGVRGE